MKFAKLIVTGIAAGAFIATATNADAATLPAHFGPAIPGFSGSKPFNATFGGFSFSANVDYAVYAPGAFNTTFPGQDPSGGSQYVYAYQLSNVGNASQRPVQLLSVGINSGVPHSNISFLNENVGGIDPTSSTFNPNADGSSSAIWTNTPQFSAGQFGEVYIFTSTFSPGTFDASVQGGGLTLQSTLPSPIPEPASAAVALGGLALAATQLRRKR